MGHRFQVWLELTPDDSHATFRDWAGRLCNDFPATLTEEYPQGYHSGEKEYWTFRMGEGELLLMRKSGIGTALGGSDVALMVRIANHWSISERVGWRWFVWDSLESLRRLGVLSKRPGAP